MDGTCVWMGRVYVWDTCMGGTCIWMGHLYGWDACTGGTGVGGYGAREGGTGKGARVGGTVLDYGLWDTRHAGYML